MYGLMTIIKYFNIILVKQSVTNPSNKTPEAPSDSSKVIGSRRLPWIVILCIHPTKPSFSIEMVEMEIN